MEEEAESGQRGAHSPEPAPSISQEPHAYYNADSASSNHNQVLLPLPRRKAGASKICSDIGPGPALLMVLLLICVLLQLVIILLRVTGSTVEQNQCRVSTNCSQLQDPTTGNLVNRTQLLEQCLRQEIRAFKRHANSLDRQLKALQPREQKAAKGPSTVEFLKERDPSGGKLYISHGILANFTDAVTICSKAGGQLVSPRNVEENNFVLGISRHYGHSVFLGINDLQTEGRFRYPSGEVITYDNFKFPEPNNDHGYEHCVEMVFLGIWNDKNCKEIRLVVCEF